MGVMHNVAHALQTSDRNVNEKHNSNLSLKNVPPDAESTNRDKQFL